ncbi:MAG: zinc-dependent peptidase [Verrucomicrobiota bacterium]|nr:zinc-dependent peptidase [Verrucomicrobiota bacterium]
MFDFFKRRRIKKILSRPFPSSHLEILQARFELFNHLPEDLQEALKQKMQVFLARMHFEACEGFQLDDEIRVLVAAQACLLLIGNQQRDYSKLRSILMYPRSYRAPSESRSPGGVITLHEHTVLGQSWEQGLVSLSWESTHRGASNMRDGRNVVIHEFAHQLDQEDGLANGVPILRSRARYAAWQTVFKTEYERLQDRVDQGRKTVMDAYGATHPAEFFAVASECFFEKPRQLSKHRPELYGQLQIFFGQNPAEYHR